MEPFVSTEQGQASSLLSIEAWRQQYPWLRAGFTTRLGGSSYPPYASLNGGLHVGDEADHVRSNRQFIASQAGFNFRDWTCGEQVHGAAVYIVQPEDKGRGRKERADAIADTDALVTTVPGVMLTSFYADCVPLYFVHPASRTVALAHAGWKGTVQKIAAETIRVMRDHCGCPPAELHAAIGPSIGGCCYEISSDVAEQLDATIGELFIPNDDDEQGKFVLQRKSQSADRYVADLKEINRQIMIKAGIQPTSIEISRYCTSCRTDLFFSHRKEQGRTGRMVSWIGLKEEVED